MERKTSNKDGRKADDSLPASFKVGAISLVFLVIGYQVALFVHSAGVSRILSHRDAPDTVYVVDAGLARRLAQEERAADSAHGGGAGGAGGAAHGGGAAYTGGAAFSGGGYAGRDADAAISGDSPGYRRNAYHSTQAQQLHRQFARRKVESFPFDPNTASIDDLMRLGFSEKQAQSIDSYRSKGGRFRRASDFAKSYVVADSVYERLRPFIRIPRIDINRADSAAFETLPGIGPFFAAKMVSYREELGGYSYPEQLMDIWHFDREKYDALSDLITLDTTAFAPFGLWRLSEAELQRHPYIDRHAAHGIVLYREHNPRASWTVEKLAAAGVLGAENAQKLARCRLE